MSNMLIFPSLASRVLATGVSLDLEPEMLGAHIDAEYAVALAQIAALNTEEVMYLVAEANPAKTSPMQYGGLFLDRDRDLLSALADGGRKVVLGVLGADSFIDFLSDLPCTRMVVEESSSREELLARADKEVAHV